MKKLTFILIAAVAAIFTACSGEKSLDPNTPQPPQPPVETKIPINLSLGITKVTENSFDNGDKVGLYVVNYSGATAGTLQTSGNHASNALYTYNSGWQASSQLYWKDETTHADFYAYHPYSATVSSISEYPFSLNANQSTEANYKSGDFLWGKTSDVAPTANAVNIQTKHLMSAAVITVAPGGGFSQESLNASTISVKLNQALVDAKINLSTGAISATGTAKSITPLYKDGKYQAMIVPQTISAENFITVTVDGVDYNLNKTFTFKTGVRHKFTVTVEKLSNGINVGITGWEDDEEDNGGTAQ